MPCDNLACVSPLIMWRGTGLVRRFTSASGGPRELSASFSDRFDDSGEGALAGDRALAGEAPRASQGRGAFCR